MMAYITSFWRSWNEAGGNRRIMTIDAYSSVSEMPKFKKLNSEISALQALSFLLPKDERKNLKGLRAEFNQLVRIAEDFYQKLGDRHWVLHEDLKVDDIAGEIMALNSEELEKALIEHYRDRDNLEFYINHLKQHEALRVRWDLIQRAKDDYLSGRFDVTAMVLIAVMDGFVNDVNEQDRRGLHTREPEEMVGFDCLSGHHLGLTNVIPVFRKGFHKRVDDEVVELYRNGIMHGCVINFNNAVVATKAWNYLFAVSEWANNREEPMPEEGPSFKEVLAKYAKNKETQKRIVDWEPYEEVYEEPFDTSPLREQVELFTYWEKGQVGLMLPFFLNGESENRASCIEIVKQFYLPITLTSWHIIGCRHTAPAIAHVDTRLSAFGDECEMTFRWLHVDGNGDPTCEWEEGTWVLLPALQDGVRNLAQAGRNPFSMSPC